MEAQDEDDVELRAQEIEDDLRVYLGRYGIVQSLRVTQMGSDVSLGGCLRPFNLESKSEMEAYKAHRQGEYVGDEDDLLGEEGRGDLRAN